MSRSWNPKKPLQQVFQREAGPVSDACLSLFVKNVADGRCGTMPLTVQRWPPNYNTQQCMRGYDCNRVLQMTRAGARRYYSKRATRLSAV